ncbi:unnamed protein product, partial [Soboliphyme baturini]|uniref:Centromere protein O n=1 Tax=Soboliphyme baturini TaxID=241478 RepID=A0A183I977_9BILA
QDGEKLPDDTEVSSLKRWVEELKLQRGNDLTKLIQLEKQSLALEEQNKLSADECQALHRENKLLHARFVAIECTQQLTARCFYHLEQRSQVPELQLPLQSFAEVDVGPVIVTYSKQDIKAEIEEDVIPWLTENVVKLLTYRFHKFCLRNEVYGLTPHFVHSAISHIAEFAANDQRINVFNR